MGRAAVRSRERHERGTRAYVRRIDRRDHPADAGILGGSMWEGIDVVLASPWTRLMARQRAAKREPIALRGRKRFVRRSSGRFTSDQTKVGRSLSQDRPRRAKRTAEPGQGDKGDRRRKGRRRATA
jgi:hypothetical protein